MDVLVLIDKLDDLIHNARPVPLTDQVRVDREEIYDLLDQMRATIPEEIKQARWIVKERQEMLAEAKREAERVVKEARDQQERLISERGGLPAGRARGRGDHRGRARDRAPDPPRRRGLRRRDPLHPRGQPREVPLRRAARSRPARRPRRRARRSRLAPSNRVSLPEPGGESVSERWFSDEELAEMSRPTMERAIEAIDAGEPRAGEGALRGDEVGVAVHARPARRRGRGADLVRQGEARRRRRRGGMGVLARALLAQAGGDDRPHRPQGGRRRRWRRPGARTRPAASARNPGHSRSTRTTRSSPSR